jgi:maltose alpha-D-glucosyltransferase/alpha-amylase
LLKVEYMAGDPELYLLPLAFAPRNRPASPGQADGLGDVPTSPNELPHAAIARLQVKKVAKPGGNGEPTVTQLDGVLYDPLEEKGLPEALVEAIIRRRRFKGNAGEIQGSLCHTIRQIWDATGPVPEPALVKTSLNNTSVIAFGDRWLLKVFRRLEPGVNPEFKMGRFLTEKASFTHAPPVAGAVEYRRGEALGDEPMTLAVLEGFVPNQGDAWHYSLDALGRYFQHALTLPIKGSDLPLPHKPLLDLVEADIPALAWDAMEAYLPAAQTLGQRTGELHVALASARDDPELAPESFTALYQRSLYQSARSQARQAFELLRKRAKDLPEAVRSTATQVVGLEGEFLKRLRLILEKRIIAQRIPCHGDYHLTQVLYTGKDFVIIDFEGDPTRPFSDRRRKRSAFRDVATMIRSFHYAAQTAISRGNVRPEDVPTLQPWVRLWHLWATVAFLKGYLEIATKDSFLPKNREEQTVLLDFYLLKRVVNELRYELLNYPDRVRVPLEGLLKLLEVKE